jgi:putative flippase GtrA
MSWPPVSRQFLLFLLTGGVAAAVNFGSRMLYARAVDFPVAVVLAYLTGMVTAFVLAKLFVFRQSRQTVGRSALLFAIVNLVAVAQTLAISLLLAYEVLPALHVVRFVEAIAHGVGVLVPVFTSYLGHKHLSFR